MADDQKYYDVPAEVAKLMVEHTNYSELRKMFAKLPFGYKKAVKVGLLAEKKRAEYWEKVATIYPEVRGKSMTTNGNFEKAWEKL